MNTCEWPSADIDLLSFKTELFTDREVVALAHHPLPLGTDGSELSR